MLFTGDAGAETEERLLARGDDLRADVKDGHAHGTTPAFLGAVAPRDAIISVGRNNLFGHPALASFETLRANGVTTYRDAAVTIRTDGARFRATPFL